MSDKNIILELNRMREIMGIPHLNESKKINISETYFREKGLLLEASATDEVSEGILKHISPNTLFKRAGAEFEAFSKEFAEALERKGLTLNNVRRSLKDVNPEKYAAREATTDEVLSAIKLYLKNNSEVAIDLLKELPAINKQAMERIKLDDVIPDPDLRNLIDNVRKIEPENITTTASKDNLDAIIAQLETDFPVGSRPPEIDDLINGFKEQKGYADDITGNADSFVSKLDEPDADADFLVKDELETGKTEAEIKADQEKIDAENKAREEEKTRKQKEQDAKDKLEAKKDELVDDAFEKIKASDEYESAVNWFSRQFDMPNKKVKNILERAEKKFRGMTIRELENIESTKAWQDLISELEKKASKKGSITGKGTLKTLEFVKKFTGKLCGAIPFITKPICFLAGFALIDYFANNWSWYERNSRRAGMLAYDYILDKVFFLPTAEDNPNTCFATLPGYYDYNDEERMKIDGILKDNNYSCDNIGGEATIEIQKIKGYSSKNDSVDIIVNGEEITIKGSGEAPVTTVTKFPNTKEGFNTWYDIMSQQGKIKKDYSMTGYGWEDGAWFGNTPLKYKSETEGWEIPGDGKP